MLEDKNGSRTVHPHVCGEHTAVINYMIRLGGSSPRVWGTWERSSHDLHLERFIPTCVGNIPDVPWCADLLAVHPHVCGEHFSEPGPPTGAGGSSPRVWGTCRLIDPRLCKSRFIPTCVGNIRSPQCVSFAEPVHPHVCGEHKQRPAQIRPAMGSSPRVWGTSNEAFVQLGRLRFIPTCVGNMRITQRSSSRRAVHPHVCGEHCPQSSHLFPLPGSSPRVWGTSLHGFQAGIPARFIPTCVGNIKYSRPCMSATTVHPHVCGEHWFHPLP